MISALFFIGLMNLRCRLAVTLLLLNFEVREHRRGVIHIVRAA